MVETGADAAIRLRHALHARPDTAGNETEAAALVKDFLAERGMDPVASDLAGHGLLYRLGDAPFRLLRADLDALPLDEATGAPHASVNEGRHHACGHDGHMAMLAGALAELGADHDGPGVLALFQPAEETGEGMAACLDDRRLSDLDVEAAFAIHNVPGFEQGTVVVREGVAAVASTGLRIDLRGQTSHAAEPERGRNPIPAAAAVAARVGGLAGDRPGAVASIVGIGGGGERYGTSAGDAWIAMTLRAAADEDLAAMVVHIEEVSAEAAEAANVEVSSRLVEPFPATVNAAAAARAVRDAADRAGLSVEAPAAPFAWSEDFGHATATWGGALIGLGAGKQQPDLHSPKYDFPDALVPVGIRLWRELAGHRGH